MLVCLILSQSSDTTCRIVRLQGDSVLVDIGGNNSNQQSKQGIIVCMLGEARHCPLLVAPVRFLLLGVWQLLLQKEFNIVQGVFSLNLSSPHNHHTNRIRKSIEQGRWIRFVWGEALFFSDCQVIGVDLNFF
ncbi:hypothetical protein L1987_79995 [Smallanthus sonchifolius]|uniref:Uncharacterized protein n=1 Tax=Smallanthus sonchifolius TaxID=185202 RepID=A0ACB8YMH3_9ASTR|nr:hypothetical protein L1987_79995 [Smallanthus sonchifolius]